MNVVSYVLKITEYRTGIFPFVIFVKGCRSFFVVRHFWITAEFQAFEKLFKRESVGFRPWRSIYLRYSNNDLLNNGCVIIIIINATTGSTRVLFSA